MEMNSQQQLMEGYFLGTLLDAEQLALEKEYFNDSRVFDQMVETENELVDKYARNLLPPETRDRFEQYYLTHPQRRERANFAGALAAKLDQLNEVAVAPAPRRESWWDRVRASLSGPKLAWASSMALLVVAATAAWFLIENRRLRQEAAITGSQLAAREQQARDLQKQNTTEQARADQLASELNRLRSEQQAAGPAPSTPTFATLILTIGGTRSSDTRPPALLIIPALTEQVHLQLNLRERGYPRYSAALQAAGGKEVFASALLTPRTIKSVATLVLTIPADKFSTGDYILTLSGVTDTGEVEDVSKSLFHVEKK
jgi:hypothetical protein